MATDKTRETFTNYLKEHLSLKGFANAEIVLENPDAKIMKDFVLAYNVEKNLWAELSILKAAVINMYLDSGDEDKYELSFIDVDGNINKERKLTLLVESLPKSLPKSKELSVKSYIECDPAEITAEATVNACFNALREQNNQKVTKTDEMIKWIPPVVWGGKE